MDDYEIVKTKSGWFWIKYKGKFCRSKRTGKLVCFRSKKGCNAYIKDHQRNNNE